MSFILEALKKSEQQRQKKNSIPQEVRKRTLSQAPRQRGRWPYWVVVGGMAVILCFSWWFYGEKGQTSQQSHTVNQPLEPSTSVQLGQNKGVAETKPPVATTAQESRPVIVPAPVPREEIIPPETSDTNMEEPSQAPATQTQDNEVFVPERVSASKNDVATVAIESSQPQAIDGPYLESAPVELPLYLDLSRGLREKMPRLAMSMHYYISEPTRRMVRINNLLLHEGDWISNDLQVVEITRSGAILDFLGKLFELRSASR